MLNLPLANGIGNKFCDNRPETSYLKAPVVVYGDVKISVYSFKTLQKTL